jgi:pimeloyl-ACP methyl ester carboxylesterase
MPVSQLHGLRIGWDDIGDGPAVVVFNGIGADRATATPTAEWLVAEGFRAITLDNPGAGESERAAGRCSIRLMADVAAALLDSLGVEQAHLFGHSMGGAISQELALRRPDLVASLQLHCTWGRTDEYLAALFESWGKLVEAIGSVAVWEHMLLWAMTPAFYDENPDVVRGWLGLIADGPSSSPGGFRDHVNACVAHDAVARPAAVTAPTLITTGERDLVCRPDHAVELRASLRHSSYHVWDGVGHLPFVETPKAFGEAVLAFLRRADDP